MNKVRTDSTSLWIKLWGAGHGDWAVALAIGLIEPCAQTIGYFFHERLWHRLEKKWVQKDYHDSVIDSVSPATPIIEDMLRDKP